VAGTLASFSQHPFRKFTIEIVGITINYLTQGIGIICINTY